jgi:hypothetical protein
MQLVFIDMKIHTSRTVPELGKSSQRTGFGWFGGTCPFCIGTQSRDFFEHPWNGSKEKVTVSNPGLSDNEMVLALSRAYPKASSSEMKFDQGEKLKSHTVKGTLKHVHIVWMILSC